MAEGQHTVRRALVTGAGKGIGEAIARRLGSTGIQIVIADIDATAARRVADAIGAIAEAVDVADALAVHDMVERQGPFDICVNNAGVDQHAYFTNTSIHDWRALISVNLEAVLATTHAVLPHMRAQRYGRIVNVASEAGRLGSRGGAVYAAAKGGVIAFTKSIAREVAEAGITANVVAPGPIDTPLLQAALGFGGDKLLEAMRAATLMKRLGTPAEVAAAVAFFASDEASYITGEVLGVSGGMGCGG